MHDYEYIKYMAEQRKRQMNRQQRRHLKARRFFAAVCRNIRKLFDGGFWPDGSDILSTDLVTTA
ncbi:MAG: hypothetical protein AAF125_23265 [Chloroflexota bacterium]